MVSNFSDPRDHALGVVNLVLATRNARSRVNRLLGHENMKTRIYCYLFIATLASHCLGADIITFRQVHPNIDVLREKAGTASRTDVPGYEMITNSIGSGTNVFWVKRRIELSDRDIEQIELRTNADSTIAIVLTLTPQRVRAFGRNPDRQANRALAIFFKDKIFIVPSLDDIMTGKIILLNGVFSVTTAQELKRALDERKAEQTSDGDGLKAAPEK